MDVSKYVITSEQLLCKYAPLIGNEDDHLWGGYIRRGAVTAIIGETSAGKTTFLHNLVYRLAQGEQFLSLTPPRPLKVFYCDYESYNSVLAEHLISIGVADQWHFLNKEADAVVPRGTMLAGVVTQLLTQTQYDIVVIDPLMDADPVDENDNTAASMQVSRWRDVAHRFNCGVILVHNTGTADSRMDAKEKAATAMHRAGRKHFGRGASSRADRYDIQLNYVVVDDTTRILRVAKTRSRNMGDYWTLKFAKSDLGFEISDYRFDMSHVSPPIENETVRQLTEIVSAHPDESLNVIWRQYIDGVMPISRATFYRHAPGARSPRATAPASGESAPTSDPPSSVGYPESSPSATMKSPDTEDAHLPSACRLEQSGDPSQASGQWRSPHHAYGSYGRFLVTSEVEGAPPL